MKWRESTKIAKKLVETLLIDNGVSLREVKDNVLFQTILAKITNYSLIFFSSHPTLINEEDMEIIAIGDVDEIRNLLKLYPGFSDLDKALNELFDFIEVS